MAKVVNSPTLPFFRCWLSSGASTRVASSRMLPTEALTLFCRTGLVIRASTGFAVVQAPSSIRPAATATPRRMRTTRRMAGPYQPARVR